MVFASNLSNELLDIISSLLYEINDLTDDKLEDEKLIEIISYCLGKDKKSSIKLLENAKKDFKDIPDIYEYTSNINKTLELDEKIEVIKFAWIVIIYNVVSDHIHTNIIRRLTGQLYLNGKDVAQAKNSALNEVQFIGNNYFNTKRKRDKDIIHESPWTKTNNPNIYELNKMYKRLDGGNKFMNSKYKFGRFFVGFFKVIGWITIIAGIFIFLSVSLGTLWADVNYFGTGYLFTFGFITSLFYSLWWVFVGALIIASAEFYEAIYDIGDNSFRR